MSLTEAGCCHALTNHRKKLPSVGEMVSNSDDYETLPHHSVYVHLMAGAMAGIGEHCLMYPLDSVKTRMQSLCPCPERSCRSAIGSLCSMVKREGLFRPLRGIYAVAGGAVPAHALYFTVYEKLKYALTSGQAGYHPLEHAIAGVAATLVHDAVMNPAEVIKQRMQMFASPYQGCVECARCVLKSEGLCAFYRSYATQLFMNVPFQSTHFVMYEASQQLLNPKHTYSPFSHIVSGAIAGGVAAAVTTPLDVCKTVLNTQEFVVNNMAATNGSSATVSAVNSFTRRHCPASIIGIVGAARAIYTHRGPLGFFSGFQARVLFQMPSTAISWFVYESFKKCLS